MNLLSYVSKSKKVIKGRAINMSRAERAQKQIIVIKKTKTISSSITTPLEFYNTIISQKGKTWQKQL
ncbi:hypothetical protein O6B42_05980 [Campylobacter ureolyticus]|uniref:hypothetical protein n=1 Tax=Campylobacter ureolyticus TaxID=827 RepID=UPI0022B34DBE|nr:hypothetical protein [Campylobacter ureolyticus]MCZ6133431.1 hypothetical protein [Campylobacter ureolyticus]